MKKTFCLLAAVLILSGCTTRVTDFTMLTSKEVDMTRIHTFQRDSKIVKGSDSAHLIVIFPIGTPNAQEALARAIESVPGAVGLLDGVITHKVFKIPHLYGRSWYIVEGTALIDPQLLSRSEKAKEVDKYNLVVLDESGKTESIKEVPKSEFEKLKSQKI